MSDSLIPFGKYKGQPIEAIAEDRNYVEWLTAQDWFREKHRNLYSIVINNFCEPSETPEHNAIQARFLDEEFRLKFVSVAIPRVWWYAQADGEMVEKAIAWAASLDNRDIARLGLYGGRLLRVGSPRFENKGRDVELRYEAGLSFGVRGETAGLDPDFLIGSNLIIEIKPDVGDDFPAILRQMRRNGSDILLTRSYHGTGVSEKIFCEYMESQKMKVVFEHEIDAVEKISIGEICPDEFFSAVRAKKSSLGL